jgi:hypothetical protein
MRAKSQTENETRRDLEGGEGEGGEGMDFNRSGESVGGGGSVGGGSGAIAAAASLTQSVVQSPLPVQEKVLSKGVSARSASRASVSGGIGSAGSVSAGSLRRVVAAGAVLSQTLPTAGEGVQLTGDEGMRLTGVQLLDETGVFSRYKAKKTGVDTIEILRTIGGCMGWVWVYGASLGV